MNTPTFGKARFGPGGQIPCWRKISDFKVLRAREDGLPRLFADVFHGTWSSQGPGIPSWGGLLPDEKTKSPNSSATRSKNRETPSRSYSNVGRFPLSGMLKIDFVYGLGIGNERGMRIGLVSSEMEVLLLEVRFPHFVPVAGSL